ncbi:hypothetical protein B9J78_03225 [bacterium Unc6]|nr:hypothetical protein [bacterium Unc6]
MIKRNFNSNAPKPIGPYSQAVESGGFVFVSGQIPVDPKTGDIIGKDIEEQAEQVFQNIHSILKEVGLGLGNVVKTTIYLKTLSFFPTVNTIYQKYFKPPYPARSCIEVSNIPRGALLEIDVIASQEGVTKE